MKPTLLPGVRAQFRERVVTEQLVSARIPSAASVLATPWVLYAMETAAYEAIEPHLDAGEVSLGAKFDFEHLAPTPAGHTVVAHAVVVGVDGRRVTFDIEARDDDELIARGRHTRVIVNRERFIERARAKTV